MPNASITRADTGGVSAAVAVGDDVDAALTRLDAAYVAADMRIATPGE